MKFKKNICFFCYSVQNSFYERQKVPNNYPGDDHVNDYIQYNEGLLVISDDVDSSYLFRALFFIHKGHIFF